MADLTLRFRDLIRSYVPPWLSDRPQNKRTAGFRYLWTLTAPLDALAEVLAQGIASWMPGVGTPTALPVIGRSRGIIRGKGELDVDYAARLVAWLDTWAEASTEERIARAVHEYLPNHPRVRVVTRWGLWVTVEDGAVTKRTGPWDWDSVSHPERSDPDAPFWSDLWIIVTGAPFALRSGTFGDLTGEDGYALGHMASVQDVDAIKGLIAQWKGAHTCIRAVIWTSDPDLFDPDVPESLPNGNWGAWGAYDGSSYVASDRNTTTCRYWEPR